MTNRNFEPEAQSGPDYRRAIVPLALGTFAVGSEGLAVAGILPEISKGLNVGVPAAGQLVTVFAIAYAISAPVLAIYGSRIAPKTQLVGGLGLFAIGNLLAAITPTYTLMMVIRILMAVSAAAFVPTASAAGAALAPAESRGKALAVVWGGFTVATVIGVPLGTLLAGLASWRWTFAFIALLAAVAAVGIAALVPRVEKSKSLSWQDFAGVARNPAVIAVVVVGLLMQSGQFFVFTYIAPITQLLTGGGNFWVTGALLLFGVAAIAGNALGGSGTDRIGAHRMIVVTLLGFTAAYLGLGVLVEFPPTGMTIVIAALTTLVWGVASWAFVPPQQEQLVSAEPDRSAVALSLNLFAFQAGIAIGGGLGGAVFAGGNLRALPYVGAAFTAVALVAALAFDRQRKRGASHVSRAGVPR